MSKVVIPEGYKTPLPNYEMQRAIEFIKSNFQVNISNALNLRRVSAPLFVDVNSGLNDNLNGYERPVQFDIPDVKMDAVVVHSLAKWKRLALKQYGFHPGKGLYTDMNAIRRDEEVDNLHSVYVDQWDWEKVISREERTVDFLKQTVRAIVQAVCETSEAVNVAFPSIRVKLDREVFFITTQELEDMYPDKTPKEREDAICREHHSVFLMQIGKTLRSGIKHDGRAPDYDDWELNGDILMWNPVLERAFEISSMGIRVDEESMARQLKLAGCEERAALPFHKALLEDKMPLTIGGGIGQSRLCMLLLGVCHIGEVQVSLWDRETLDTCRAAGVEIL
ncbi:MAG: aspartate--ammonia ligase [Oscillospiraceae bacterium]